MGNYISCTLSTNTFKHSKGAKVIFPKGEIRQYDEPIQAAELMFETPNYFVVNTKSLHIGRRFFALNADEDLEIGNVYVMVQMKRLNSIVTAGDLAALFVTSKRASGGVMGMGMARVMPAEPTCVENEQVLPRLSLDDIEDVSIVQHRLSMCRSKRPGLETIVEEPMSSR